jgi:hypothetical protein
MAPAGAPATWRGLAQKIKAPKTFQNSVMSFKGADVANRFPIPF